MHILQVKKCSGRHALRAAERNDARCDVCRVNIGSYSSHSCTQCNYDLCNDCYGNSNLRNYGSS